MKWWEPKGKTIWVLFDCSNGDSASKRYLWWFDTRKAALEHKRHVEQLEGGADLSKPVKVRLA